MKLLFIILSIFSFVYCFERPNILFIVADDLGWHDVGYHDSELRTPTIDKLAQEGIKLENYYVEYVCTPSRATFMTGRYPIRYGLQRMVLEPDNPFALSENETILPQILKQEGYSNYAIGKWHLGSYKWRYTPTYRGFDQFYGYYQGGEDYYSHSILKGYDLRNETKPNCGPDCSKVDFKSNGTYSTFLFTQEVERMLRNHNSSKPFYMYLAQQGVHSPTEAPQEYIDKFKHIKNLQRRTFAAQLYLVDESIKNITNIMKELGYLNNTLIIFTTDNGACQCNSECLDNGGCNWPYRSGKESQFNGGVKGISFISGKIVQKYKTNNFTVYNGMLHGVDWLPTITGLLNISIENKTLPLDGFNQWNEIIGNTTSKRNEILLNTIKDEVDSYIMGDWKYISGKVICAYDGWIPLPVTNDKNYPSDECLPNRPNDYLFNIKEDPFEKVNLIDKYPEIVEKIKKKIQVYKDEAVDENPGIHDPKADPSNFGGVWTPWDGI